jgi:uncharacterized membrane protein YuzA (DUF378 family)
MAVQNVTEIIGSGFEQSIQTLVAVVGIILGIAGVYLIFWIITAVINYRRNKITKEILENVKEINRKLSKKK